MYALITYDNMCSDPDNIAKPAMLRTSESQVLGRGDDSLIELRFINSSSSSLSPC